MLIKLWEINLISNQLITTPPNIKDPLIERLVGNLKEYISSKIKVSHQSETYTSYLVILLNAITLISILMLVNYGNQESQTQDK